MTHALSPFQVNAINSGLLPHPSPASNRHHNLRQHRGEASGIAFHPQNPSLVATVGLDGLVHCVDIRVGDSAGGSGNGLRSTETGVPLTCVSFHHEVKYVYEYLFFCMRGGVDIM